MKKSAAILLFTLCCVPFLPAQERHYGQEPPKAKQGVDYPIKVHISGIHIASHCTAFAGHALCEDALYADALMDGKKIELMGDAAFFPGYQVPLLPGDYQARLLKDAHKVGDSRLYQKYEVLLPDRITWRATVTGIFE
jgi:hypothetical protein